MIGKQISAEELEILIKEGLKDSIVVDVRTSEECEKGVISGAINIPLNQILNKVEILRPYKNIYLYCLSGGRSQLALAQLTGTGLTDEIYSLTSGLLAWRKQGFPLI